MHCDLVESTKLSARIDPESLQKIIHQFLDASRIAIKKNNGYTAGFTGDGIEAYFGYPNADEDSAYNAVISAINLKDSISSITTDSGEYLQIRIGIATGTVVTEKSTHTFTGKNSFVFGLTPALAARLEEAALPNTILIDELTAKLAGPSIHTIELGEKTFKGFTDSLSVLQVNHADKKLTRFDAHSERFSPFVGRENELETLRSLWSKTQVASGSTTCIIGEPGIGKSRLVYEFSHKYTSPNVESYVLQCSSQHISSPLYPWLRFIESKCNILPTDKPANKKQKIELILGQLTNISDSELAVLFFFIYPDDKEQNLNVDLTPDRRATIIKNLILKILQATSKIKPTIIVVEDIQWMDPSTESILTTLSSSPGYDSILFILTSRTIKATDAFSKNIKMIFLEKLDSDNVMELTRRLLENKNLKLSIVSSIISRGGGNPLYIEELAKSMLANFDSEISDELENSEIRFNSIPKSLNAILMAQLDAFPKAKKTAQIAATIGREFRLSSVEHIAKIDTDTIHQHVKTLIDNDIIFNEQRSQEDIFIFKHALVQEAAYETQLNSKKKTTHLQIAKFLSSKTQVSNADPELIAHHYEKGDKLVDAFAYWVKAGVSRLENGATKESVKLLKQAEVLLNEKCVFDAKHNTASERDYYLTLAKALNATEGANSEQAVNSYAKASYISELLGDIDTQVHALDSQFGIIFNSGKINNSEPPARKMLDIGRQKNHKISEISGLQSIGMIEFTRGNFKEAKIYLEESVKDSDQYKYGLNSYPSLALMYLSWACYFLGEYEDSKILCEKSVASGRSETPYSLGVSLGNSCYYYQFSEDYCSLRKNARELVDLSIINGQIMWENRGRLFLNWAEVMDHLDLSCLSMVEESVEQLLSSGEEIDTTFYLGLLAEAQSKNGLMEKALRNVNRAIELAIKNGEEYYLAPLYILKGDLSPTKNNNNKLSHYKAAKKLAIKQSAPKWVDIANESMSNKHIETWTI